jgi:PadR family transcriptional regulator PadR
VFLEVRRLDDERLAFPSSDRMTLERHLGGGRMCAAVEIEPTFPAPFSSKGPSGTSTVLYDGYLHMVMPLDSAIDAAKKGSADLLILSLLEAEALHGYDIAGRIEMRSGGTLRFTLASLYATLYRLEERELIRGRWVERAGQRRRRYYRITTKGRAALASQRDDWSRFIAAVTQVAGLRPA